MCGLVCMQLVVAYDPPPDVTMYIQCRGRARAPGSIYAWLKARGSFEVDLKKQQLLR